MKTSLVQVTVKVVVQHRDDEDPTDIIDSCDYEFVYNQDDGKILDHHIEESEDLGECHPTEHYLIEEHERNMKRCSD